MYIFDAEIYDFSSGLTAVRSEDVLDVMFNDFPAKFEELQRLLRERKENEMRERGKGKTVQ